MMRMGASHKCSVKKCCRAVFTVRQHFSSLSFSKTCSLAEGRVKDTFADTEIFRCYLKKLVRVDKVDRLFQT